MSSRTKSAATVVICGAALAVGAWALGTGVGSERSDAATSRSAAGAPVYGPPPGMAPGRMGPGHGPRLAGLAARLGVSEVKLRAALRTVTEAERARREDALATALSAQLDLPRGKVAAALAKARPDRTERRERRLARGGFVRRLARALGMRPREVRAALRRAQAGDGPGDFDALASALGVSPARLRDALVEAMPRPGRFREERRRRLTGLATALGVPEAKLRAALGSARPALRPDPGELAAALAKELGIPVRRVRAALGRFHPEGPPL